MQANRPSSGLSEGSPEERRQKSMDERRTLYSATAPNPSQPGHMPPVAKAARSASLKRVLSMSGLQGIRRWVSFPGQTEAEHMY